MELSFSVHELTFLSTSCSINVCRPFSVSTTTTHALWVFFISAIILKFRYKNKSKWDKCHDILQQHHMKDSPGKNVNVSNCYKHLSLTSRLLCNFWISKSFLCKLSFRVWIGRQWDNYSNDNEKKSKVGDQNKIVGDIPKTVMIILG